MFRNWKSRTGTKVMIFWLIFVGLIVIWLLIIAPFIPAVSSFIQNQNVSMILTALLGSGGLLGGIVEIRKAIENSKRFFKENEQ